VRAEMRRNFERDGGLDTHLLFYRINIMHKNAYEAYGLFIGNVPPQNIQSLIGSAIKQYAPDAYIIVGQAHIVLTRDPESARRRIEEAGSVEATPDSKSVVSFIFETHMQTLSEVYDVVRIDEKIAVLANEPESVILDGFGNYIGYLNTNKLITSNN